MVAQSGRSGSIAQCVSLLRSATLATQGKLGYLDFTQPDLPLRIGPGTQLPALYRNIQGAHYSYMWRNGEFIANIHQGRRVLKKLIYPF